MGYLLIVVAVVLDIIKQADPAGQSVQPAADPKFVASVNVPAGHG
jgi:hypothetical protein